MPTRDLVFGRSDRGRPLLTGAAASSAVRLDLNVSHHGPLVVLAAVAADAQECGEHPSGKDSFPFQGLSEGACNVTHEHDMCREGILDSGIRFEV